MYFYFTDRKFNLLGIASDDRRTKIRMTGVKDSLSIKRATRLFDGNIEFNRSSANTVKDMAMAGNYILYRDSRGKNVWLTIMEFEHNPAKGAHYFSAEDAGMDLINETVPAYKADKAYPIAYYINKFTADSGFEIGINEISDLTRTLTWESESSTALARIISVATQFDNAEIDFSFEIEGLQVTKKYINIYKKRGSDKRVTLNVDYDINNIITKGNIYNLFTSVYATGGTPQGKDNPINLKGYKYTDPNGRFVLGSDGIMRDTVAVQKWSRLLSNDNPNPKSSHIQRVLSFETTSQKVLCDTVIRQLEQNSEIYFDYEVDLAKLPNNTEIGDTIYLADEFGELYLSARVLEINQEYSSRKYTATLGDYVIQDSGISSELQDLANKLQNSVPYIWTRYADDDQGNGMTANPAGKVYMANKTVKGIETPSDDPDDYTGLWVKIKGDEGTPGTSPIVTPNEDGTITIVDEEGTKTTPDLTGPEGKPGDNGIGIDGTKTKTDYQLGTSATTAPTGTWVAKPPAVTVGKYLWTRTILTYTDGTKSTPAYSISGGPGKDGDKGDKGDTGDPGKDALPIFDGRLTAPAITLSATNSGAVSDFSKATGTFVTYLGQDQLTSGVTYSRVSQSGITATINTTTGAYSVTAASADNGMAVFRATYGELMVDKMVSVTKAKQGAGGKQGEPGKQGDGSYLHVAWKMADDTFSPVYPGENLLLGSLPEIAMVGDGTANQLPSNRYLYFYKNDKEQPSLADLGLKAGDKLTFSAEYEISGTGFAGEFSFRLGLASWLLISPNQSRIPITKAEIVKIKQTVTLTDAMLANTYQDSRLDNVPATVTIKVRNRKLEIGANDSPVYTPTPAEDYSLAYPKYRGEYTDHTEASSTNPDDYTWTAYLGEQGPPTGVISQSTIPSSPYVGMLWQNTGNVSGYISNATYRWNGSKWEIYQFTAQNILAETFTGFVFRGVEFIGSKFVSEFDIPIGAEPNAHAVGQTVIENGSMVTDMVEYWTGVAGGDYDKHLEFSPDNGVFMSYKGRRSDVSQEAQLTPGGLRIKTAAAEAILSVDTIYSLVNPARNNTAPPDDANRKGVVVNYFRVGNLVNVAIKFELLKDTGWVALAPWPPSGYAPASMYQASGVAGSVSYRGQTCMVYCNTDGLRLIPTTGQGTGVFQLSLTWTTNDPFPYGDS